MKQLPRNPMWPPSVWESHRWPRNLGGHVGVGISVRLSKSFRRGNRTGVGPNRDHAAHFVAKTRGVFLRPKDWVADDGFGDQIHLRRAGAVTFFRRSAQWISEQEKPHG